jgi:oligopeptide/dipeptide ABC transporter ATP-binding protein
LNPVLEARSLTVRFPVAGAAWRSHRWLTAVDGVSFALARGEALGVVGESGCGKSTLGRALLGLVQIHSGTILLGGSRVDGASGSRLRQLRRNAQMIFQDPSGSLDPRRTVGQSVAEPLEIYEPELRGKALRSRVARALDQVGLAPEYADRYPHEFSGGQCQRIGIARAVILRPALIVCDEPVSALDVSVQGQVVNLLARLRDELGLAYVFISHNLAVVRHLSPNVLVMYLGRTMEHGPREELYRRPLHPYTRALLESVPRPDPVATQRPAPTVIVGEPPSPLAPPAGCVFQSRCPLALPSCAQARPPLEEPRPGHRVACHRWREWRDGLPPAGVPT